MVDSVTSSDFTVNPGYDGNVDTALLTGTDTLGTATTGTVAVTTTVTPGASPGPYNNTATAGGVSPGGAPLSDDSTDGTDPDPDSDGNPLNDECQPSGIDRFELGRPSRVYYGSGGGSNNPLDAAA